MSDTSSSSDLGGNDGTRDVVGGVNDVADDEIASRSSFEEHVSLSSKSVDESGLDRSTRDSNSSTWEPPRDEDEPVFRDRTIHEVRCVREA